MHTWLGRSESDDSLQLQRAAATTNAGNVCRKCQVSSGFHVVQIRTQSALPGDEVRCHRVPRTAWMLDATTATAAAIKSAFL
jgi:hypothetical protein